MNLKIVESSLNLRVERRLGKENKDYLLSKEVAEEQLKLEADVYCNVEYMECKDENEKKQRESTEEMLLNLLEETCNKLDCAAKI